MVQLAEIEEFNEIRWHIVDVDFEEFQQHLVRSGAHQVSPITELSNVGSELNSVRSHSVAQIFEIIYPYSYVVVGADGVTARWLVINIEASLPDFHEDVSRSAKITVVAHYCPEVSFPPINSDGCIGSENMNVMEVKHHEYLQGSPVSTRAFVNDFSHRIRGTFMEIHGIWL